MDWAEVLKRSWIARAWLPVAVLLCCGAAPAADPPPLPPWSAVQASVSQYFQGLPEFDPGGILARGEVAPLFERLAALGWEVPDRGEILSQVPADNEFLVVQLRTPAGRKFAARIRGYPGGYDRLERLSRLPQGKQMVRDLIRGPGGEKLIQYLAEAQGGAEMGRMLSATPRGKGFQKPTGRIYTAAMLLERLQESYRNSQQPAK